MGRLDDLRAAQGGIHPLAQTKVKDFLEPFVTGFIQQSPFAVVASSNAAGDCDASPKGGEPGFIKVLDDRTLMMPDIAGNNLFQSFDNYAVNPKIGLIFMIPGMDVTVRVNGRVAILEAEEVKAIVSDPELEWHDEKAQFVQGIIIQVDEAYFHCPRSFKFANLWDVGTIQANIKRPISSLSASKSAS